VTDSTSDVVLTWLTTDADELERKLALTSRGCSREHTIQISSRDGPGPAFGPGAGLLWAWNRAGCAAASASADT